MNRLFSLALLSFLFLPAPAADPIKVFLFAGQSNMEGADTDPGEVSQFPPYRNVFEPLKNVRYSYQTGANHRSDGWTTLRAVADDFGPEITFARFFRQRSDAPLALIKDAWGGTTLINDWAPDGGDEQSKKLYARFLTHIRERLAELDKEGVPYEVEALMWHQGENDMFHPEGKLRYGDNLRNFIASLRQDLGLPGLKVYLGEISTKGIWGMDNRGNVALIRQGQVTVAESDPRVFFVPTSHLAFKVGRPIGLHYHFGTLGQLQHGEAYARAWFPPNPIPQEDKMPRARSEKGQAKLFVLGGQRNMEGENAWLRELEDDPANSGLTKTQRALFKYDIGKVHQSDHWQDLGPVDPLGNFGPELSFGRQIIPTMTDSDTMAIYKFTDSGSQSLDWLPEGSAERYRDRYQAWIEGIKTARQELIDGGYDCAIQAVFWHCGENDRALDWMADKYAARFQSFMEATRKDLGQPELPFLVTEQPLLPASISGDKKLYDLNADLEALAAKDPNLHFIKTTDLPHQAVLFGTKGAVALGERMAKSWLRMQSK